MTKIGTFLAIIFVFSAPVLAQDPSPLVKETGPVLRMETSTQTIRVPVTVYKEIQVPVPRVYMEQTVRTEIPIGVQQTLPGGTSRTVVQPAGSRKTVSAPNNYRTATTRYVPKWTIDGLRSGRIVTEHLQESPHNVPAAALRYMSLDDQWRLHDELHEKTVSSPARRVVTVVREPVQVPVQRTTTRTRRTVLGRLIGRQ